MLSTFEAFEKFRQKLELSDTEAKDAQRRNKDVRECIRESFDIENDFLSGSYARQTKTKPLQDVDVLFVLGEGEKWRRKEHPLKTLEAFEKQFKKYYKDEGQVRIDRRCVILEFEKPNYSEGAPDKVLSVDNVPAFAVGDHYEIPDQVTGTWIKTNPKVHAEKATEKNEQLDGRWVPLIKMIKAWNRANGNPIMPSFLLEVMAPELVDPPSQNFSLEIRNFFGSAAGAIDKAWPDPAGLGPPVSDQVTSARIATARAALLEAERKASNAARLEKTSQGDALRLWREILGPYFPLS